MFTAGSLLRPFSAIRVCARRPTDYALVKRLRQQGHSPSKPFASDVKAIGCGSVGLSMSESLARTHGTLSLNANGSFTYTPSANANDGGLDSNVARLQGHIPNFVTVFWLLTVTTLPSGWMASACP